MKRLKINLPESFQFEISVPVRIYDTNFGGHLGHDSVVHLMHEARARFFHSMNYSELNVEGAGIIVVDLSVQYIAEAMFSDMLQVKIAVVDFTRCGCVILYQLNKAADQTEIARGQTSIVFFDYNIRKTVTVPDKFRRKISTGKHVIQSGS